MLSSTPGGIDRRAVVLVITRYWPVPPINGAFKYTKQVVDALGDSYQVRVMGAHYPGVSIPSEHAPLETASFTRRMATWGCSGLPMAASLFATPSNRVLLESLLDEIRPSIIVLDHLASAWAMGCIRGWQAKRGPAAKVVYVAHNVESKVRSSAVGAFSKQWMRMAANALDAFKCANLEKSLARSSSLVSCISAQDASDFRGFGAAHVLTFQPGMAPTQFTGAVDYRSRPRKVLVLGSFIWDIKRQNLTAFLTACANEFARDGIEVKVLGWMTEPHLSQFRTRWPEVRFTGFVDNPGDELNDVRLGLVIDAAGGGFKLKLLDYVTAGLPVVGLTSAVGADVARDNHSGVLLAEDFADLREKVASVIDSPDLLEAMCERSTEYFSRKHNVGAAAATLLTGVAECMEAAAGRGHAG
jgi:polysaccharide biosynthesis protein PslH